MGNAAPATPLRPRARPQMSMPWRHAMPRYMRLASLRARCSGHCRRPFQSATRQRQAFRQHGWQAVSPPHVHVWAASRRSSPRFSSGFVTA